MSSASFHRGSADTGQLFAKRPQHVIGSRGAELLLVVVAARYTDGRRTGRVCGLMSSGVSPTTNTRRGSTGSPRTLPARTIAVRVSSVRSLESDP